MLEIDLPKEVMVYVMTIFDVCAAMFTFYSALKLTDDFGFGSRRQVLLLVHRVLCFAVSFAFANHAYDIWRDPVRHGLTTSNFELHAIMVALYFVSAVRITIAEKNHHKGGNGGLLTGPFGRAR
jgi:hypothetical protein